MRVNPFDIFGHAFIYSKQFLFINCLPSSKPFKVRQFTQQYDYYQSLHLSFSVYIPLADTQSSGIFLNYSFPVVYLHNALVDQNSSYLQDRNNTVQATIQTATKNAKVQGILIKAILASVLYSLYVTIQNRATREQFFSVTYFIYM